MISSFFKRKAGETKKEQQKQKRPRTAGPAGMPEKTEKQASRRVEPELEFPVGPVVPARKAIEKIENEYKKQKQEAEESLQALLQQKREYEAKVRKIEQRAAKAGSENLGYKQDEGSPVALSGNRIAEGVIWSEILGPPRTRRPYNRRKYR